MQDTMIFNDISWYLTIMIFIHLNDIVDIWMVLARSIRRTTSSSTWSHPAGWIDSFRAGGQGGPMVTDSNPKRKKKAIYHDLSLF